MAPLLLTWLCDVRVEAGAPSRSCTRGSREAARFAARAAGCSIPRGALAGFSIAHNELRSRNVEVMNEPTLSSLLAEAELALASAKSGDPQLEASLNLGRLASARGEPRAVGLLLSAIDAAEALGREDVGRSAVLELGRCLVRGGDVVLGRGNLERALGEAQRAEDPRVEEHVALAALGLVEAWLAEGDLERAQATLALAPREAPQRALAQALLEIARGEGQAAVAFLEQVLSDCDALADPISAATLAHEARGALAALRTPSAEEQLCQVSADDLRVTLSAIVGLCDTGREDTWSFAADALRRLQGARAVELEIGKARVRSPARVEFDADRELSEGLVTARFQGGEAGERDLLSRIVLKVCQRLTASSLEASGRVLQMLDRLLESDLEGSQFFELATQLAVEATGAARGRLVRLPSGSESGWSGSEESSFVSRSLLRHVVLTGRPLLLEDAREAPPASAGESVGAKGLRSVVAAPLFGRRGRVLGVLYLDDPGAAARFGAAEAAVVAGFAARLGTHLENDLRARLRPSAPTAICSHLLPAKLVESARSSDAPVLVAGESGVGKEHFARAVHAESSRAERPFVVLACGTVADELLESELFGHEVGAFTGANARRDGLFQRAEGGVLLLDGLQDASPRLQAELLRAVESGEVRPLGGTVQTVRVRVLATYQGDPLQGVREGRLRQDLYYRLSVLRIDLPPLRERRAEIRALIRGLLDRLGAAEREVTAKAMARLEAYPWPGNLRELQASLERALLEADGDTLRARHFRLEAPARLSGEPLRLNPRQLHVMTTLTPGRALRTGDHAANWSVSAATAWRDLTGLVKAGVLQAEGKGRGAVYRRSPDAPPI
jgi:hypothetical protein